MARILLVDDDPDQLEIRKLVLETQEHQVSTAVTRQAAQKAFADCEPQLAILDLRLPELSDGQALIRDLRRRSSSLRIIVLSGLASDVSQLPEARLVDAVLQKPFDSARLLELVARLAVPSEDRS